MLPAFNKQGHRGCRGLMPENTWPAMKMALDLGVHTLEMDVVITRDRKVLLSHEPYFSAEITTKPDGTFVPPGEEKQLNIFQMDLGEVTSYDVGMKPYPRFPRQQKINVVKPTLESVIAHAEAHASQTKRAAPFYNIEIKSDPSGDLIFHPEVPEFVELLMAVVRSSGIQQRVIIQSFDFRALRYLHQQYPEIKTAMLVENLEGNTLDELLKELDYLPAVFSPIFKGVDRSLVAACHEKNIRIIPWTVNDPSTIRQLIEMGVDGIITDYPDLFD